MANFLAGFTGTNRCKATLMNKARHILKVAIAVVEGHSLLVVRKRSSATFILPGGKPERREDDMEALTREVWEELGCTVRDAGLFLVGDFSDVAADHRNTTVTVRLFYGLLGGKPSPKAEIEECRWYSPLCERDLRVAPSISNKIVPHLLSAKLLPRISRRQSKAHFARNRTRAAHISDQVSYDIQPRFRR